MSMRSTTYLTGAARTIPSTLDGSDSAIGVLDIFLENCGAKLTEAAYPVMLRHGAVDNWLDLELELWKILTEIVRNLKQDGRAPVRR
jgi:hypothetical protein